MASKSVKPESWPAGGAQAPQLQNALSDCLDVIEPIRDELRKQGKEDAATCCDEVIAYAREALTGGVQAPGLAHGYETAICREISELADGALAVAPHPWTADDARDWQEVWEETKQRRAGAPHPVPTAGDLLIRAVDKWASHAMRCDLDECEPCVTAINQLRLAYKVWQSSAHQSAGARLPPAPEPLTRTPAPHWPLSVQDIDDLVQGIEEFIISGDAEVQDIWQPYIDKLNALKALAAAPPQETP